MAATGTPQAPSPVLDAGQMTTGTQRAGLRAAAAPPVAGSLRQRLRDYVTLTKPRIISLLLVTTLAPMVIAARGWPSGWTILWTMVGGYLMAGGANAINMYLDRDIDRVMVRTSLRPIPSGRMSPGHVLGFGILLGVFASDTGGYIAGVLAGRHPMAPTISPKKSWEGFAGSVAGSCLAGWLTVTYALDGDAWVGVLLGVATAVTATVGDLVESLIKRDLGIKDMGSLLPGHGGMMDRLDSLLLAAPVTYLLLSWLVPA